ncbi:MAG: tripartite tricarboxylate transporter TctB family protein [Stomatobaculum sp.]|nr:tripartite tricarboxylate transporter TctB family protein [Stomatobaculum sp.]
MTNKQRNLLTAVLFLAFGVFMFIQSQGVKHKIASDVGSGYVPAFIAGCLIVVSAAKLIITLTRHDPDADKKQKSDSSTVGGVVTILIILVYMLAFEKVGFIVSSILFLFALMNWFANSKNRNIPLFAVISVIMPIAVSALFNYVIKMPLPKGIIGF